ncbi:MAG: hypothetical protein GC159_07950 [Phycisphaera sp.]|nr:hypothetical protein [Phycisphaera sp.]
MRVVTLLAVSLFVIAGCGRPGTTIKLSADRETVWNAARSAVHDELAVDENLQIGFSGWGGLFSDPVRSEFCRDTGHIRVPGFPAAFGIESESNLFFGIVYVLDLYVIEHGQETLLNVHIWRSGCFNQKCGWNSGEENRFIAEVRRRLPSREPD